MPNDSDQKHLKDFQDLQDKLKSSKARWTAKQTPQSKFSLAQKKALLGVIPNQTFLNMVKQQGEAIQAPSAAPLPSTVDWRQRNGKNNVTPVKDQLNCGSCVSFGTVGLMESMALIECNFATLDLSEADLHFCSSHGANCNGWYPSDALESAKTRGVCSEACFPYASAFTAGTPHCSTSPDRNNHLVKITSSDWFILDSSKKRHLAEKGPLTACFDVYDDFYSYGSGIYHHVSGDYQGGHCILVIGYSNADKCWICKNSWGTGWGDGGYFRIAYGECNIDSSLQPHHSASGIQLHAHLQADGILDSNCTAGLLAVDQDFFFWVDPGKTDLYQGSVKNGVLSPDGTIDTNCRARLLAVDKGLIYWADTGGKNLYQGDVVNGKLVANTTIDPNCTARFLAVDNGNFYWVDPNSTKLYQGRVMNGRLSCMSTIDPNCTAKLLSVDHDHFYWIDQNSSKLFQGMVVNGRLSCFYSVDDNCQARQLVVNNCYFHWVDQNQKDLYQGSLAI